MAEQIQKKIKKDEQKKQAETVQDVSRPDTSAAEAKIEKALKDVEVLFGSESQTLQLSGHSVQDTRDTLKHVLNIPNDAQARVNGNLVDGSYILQENDTLEFVKVSGQKGL
jgi:hypothetical protein